MHYGCKTDIARENIRKGKIGNTNRLGIGKGETKNGRIY